MSRADECYDNAFMESCWGTYKRELAIAGRLSAASIDAAFAVLLDSLD
ncbi:MAG: hypothetical protein ACRDD1_03830 [Planctomycetia bacterium]